MQHDEPNGQSTKPNFQQPPGSLLIMFPTEGGFQTSFVGPIPPGAAVNALEIIKGTFVAQQVAQMTAEQHQKQQGGIVQAPAGLVVSRNRAA